MATEPDYYIITFDTDRGLFPWAWELRRRSKPMGVKIREKGYQSQTAAEHAGKRALEDFLRALAQEEDEDRRHADNAYCAPVRPAGQSIGYAKLGEFHGNPKKPVQSRWSQGALK